MSDATAHEAAHAAAPREAFAPVAFMALLFLGSIGLAMAFSSTFVEHNVRAFEDPDNLANPVIYLGIVVVFTAIVLLIAKYGRRVLIRYIILLAVLLTVHSVAWPLLASWIGPSAAFLGYGWPTAISLAIAVGLTALLYFYPEWYVIDAAGLLIAAGAAGIFGISFGLLPSILLLVAFAVYDAIAVYRTKHMLDLADSVLELRLPIMFVVPKHRGYSFLEETARVRQEPEDLARPPREAMFMGLGDAVIPAVLVVSAQTFLAPVVAVLGVPGPLVVALATLAGSFAGFLVLMALVLRGNPHAGLPLLNGGALVGFLAALLPLYGLAPLWPF